MSDGTLTLSFEPLDVLLFRDHRPFDAGKHVVARARFPQPSVFRGCLRTALFRELGVSFDRSPSHTYLGAGHWANEWLGNATDPGHLEMRGPLLARLIPQADGQEKILEPCYPWPADATSDQPTRRRDTLPDGFAFAQWRTDGQGAVATLDPSFPWTPRRADTLEPLRWLTPKGLAVWQYGNSLTRLTASESAVTQEQLFVYEWRVGIQRHRAYRVAEDQMFYLTQRLRLQPDVRFVVEVRWPSGSDVRIEEAVRSLHGRVVPLGGRRHRARIEVHHTAPVLIPEPSVGPGQAARAVLLSPCIPPISGSVVGVAGRREWVGGFDFNKRAPKSLRAAYGMGSVLWLSQRPPDDWAMLGKDTQAGYGLAAIGVSI